MSLLRKYSSSAKLSEDGKEFQLTEEGWITVRRSDCRPAKDLREELESPYAGIGIIPESKTKAILIEIAAKALIVGWRGKDWADEEGNEIAFSSDKALELLSDPDQEPLVAKIYELANNAGNFRAEEVKRVKGN